MRKFRLRNPVLYVALIVLLSAVPAQGLFDLLVYEKWDSTIISESSRRYRVIDIYTFTWLLYAHFVYLFIYPVISSLIRGYVFLANEHKIAVGRTIINRENIRGISLNRMTNKMKIYSDNDELTIYPSYTIDGFDFIIDEYGQFLNEK